MKKLNELQSYLTRLRGLMLTLIILCSIGSGNVWGADTELTFSLTSNPGGWPTTNSTTLTNYTYTLSGTNYTFALKNVKQNSGYLMLTSTAVLGLPAISGMTLTKVVVSNSSGCSTSTRVGISSSSSSASYISGGAYQTYSTTSSTYTYNLTGTSANTMYYLYVTNKNCQITQLKLTYSGGSTPSLTASPTSLDWGSVAKGTSLSTKTFSISGSNLTSGSLSITASSGWSVSPTSKSVSGTLDPTTVTVTPPSTSTAGTKNGTITISGGGLASSVVVNLSLTVNEVDNFIDVVQSTSGYTEGSPHQETGSYSTPTLTDKSVATSGTCEELHYHFVGWITKTKYDAGTSIAVGDLQTPTSATGTTYYAVWAKQAAGGSSNSISLTYTDFGYTNTTYSTKSVTKGGFTFTCKQGCRSNSPYSLQMNSSKTGHLYNTTAIAGLQSVTLKCNATNTGKTATIYQGASQEPTSSSAGTAACAASKNYTINITSGSYFTIAVSGATYFSEVVITYSTITYEDYIAKCCDDPGLAYGTGSVTKTYGADAFTNTLTNSHSVAVTYSSSDETVATVNGSGQVTILKAGSTTITASSAAQTVAAVSYCADEASYTLTVNKADISPTLTYDPAAVTVGSTLTSFTLSGNSGSGTVTYVSSNDAIATVNSSGVVTGVAPGTVTITATIAATTNYNGNTATSNTITVNAAACTGVNSLHTGNKDQGGWVTNQCFEDADWGAADDAIYVSAFPLTNECYVGWAGGNSYHGTYWAVGGIKTYDIPTGRTLGWNSGNYYESYPGGALGTFHIYKNSTDENYYLRFKPSSYILRTGSDGTSWTSREMTVSATNSHYYETAELDLTSTLISEHAYVDLKTNGGDGHVWCNFSNDRTASGNVKVKSSVGDADGNFRGDNLKASDNGTHGKFRIDVTKDVDNWKLAFVPMYRITYAEGTGASGSMDPSSYAEISTTIVAAANGFTAPTGKQFNGWSDGINSYAAGANVTMNSNVTLTAQWTDIDYTVTVSQSPDVSATTTGQTSSAHYNGTINLTTTVPSGYRFVNWTTSDGFSITNPTSATTASFTMPAKNVTVTANFQQTHTVDWYVGGSASANKIGDDGQTTVVDHGGKISDFPAHDPDGSACDKEFVGWTNTSSYVHGTSPLFNDVAGSPTINADANFYAVFAEAGDITWTRVTSVSTITGGGTFIIGYEGTANSGVLVPLRNNDGTASTSANGILYSGTTSGSSTTGTITMSSLGNNGGDDYEVTITSGTTSGKVSIKLANNNYIGVPTSGNNVRLYAANNTTYTDITPTIGDDDVVNLMMAADSALRYNTGGSQRFVRYKTNTGAGVVLYKKTGGYSGYTINCADCGSSVTPTYTAAPTGGTVSVTKSAAAVASGSTVKTCTSVDLTVTINPAPHYTLTGFTATGLSTGTATISPAVGSTLPKTTETTFTVTVSSGATGTLNLTPTFTPETPLTITLNTNGKGTYTDPAEWPIYAGESFTLPDVTPSDPTCATFVGWIQGTTFPGDATTHDAPLTISAGSSSGELSVNTTYTAVFYETETAESDAYVKVTSAPVNWANDHYLIVYEDGGVAFDGSLSTLDASSNTVAVSISSGAIAATSALAASEWKIALISGSNYSIQSASGKYIGNASNSNGLTADNTALGNTLSISSENFGVVSAGGAYLRYNATSGQERFRYYKSSSYSSQQAIQLYKLGTAVVETRTYTTNPACTPKYRVTVASVTGGSPNANPKFLPENEEVTLTANPAAGYSFTSWTITKTTGGDDVTTTLLGANATTANTTFSMPAYDVTVTASFAKKVVTSLQVKDGETVIPSSGTVNISTGANKTLDVVITPADAFDHSWTASVTAGGTYASITNVQAGTFQVNGLAQGDATVTVTAPNDGDAKTVTFTVHVTDILPTEVVLKRDGSNTSISELSIYEGQYVKVNVSFTPTPTNKDFSVSADGTFVTIHAHAHTNPNYYATLNGKKVTTSPVNVTFTSAATSSVTKNLVVTVLPLLTDTFVDYIHGQATQTVSARLSVDKFTLYTDINTPSLSDASDADPTSADCETSHYHLIGWLPKATAEALWAAGTAITESTEGLVKAGVQVEATGQTWYAIWGKEQ